MFHIGRQSRDNILKKVANFDNMRTAAGFIIITALGFIFTGCTPKHNNPVGGGKGGSATIIAEVDHYGSLIDTATVYIKYGTLDFPADSVFDDSLKVQTNYHAVFSGLTIGNYYLLAKGIHGGFSPPTVHGGRPWTINSATAVDTVAVITYQY